MPKNPKLSWQMIKKILEYAGAVGRDNYIVIQRSLDNWLRSLPVEEQPMETAPDIRTIRRVVEEELEKLSPEVLIEQLPQSVWRLRTDYEQIKELANGPTASSEIIHHGTSDSADESRSEANLFDRNIFNTSDNIMNERELRDFLLGLELHHNYRLSEYLKVVRFWEFIGLEGNKYTDTEARQLLNNLWSVLDDLVPFLKEEFKEDAKVKKEKDLEYRFDPSGLRYLRDDSAKAERITEVESQLDELINATRESYKAYRAGIRSRLHV